MLHKKRLKYPSVGGCALFQMNLRRRKEHMVKLMKAIVCPSCSAPITIKQGLSAQKCSFCDTEVKADFDSAPEFTGLDDRQFEKLLRRATDSEERGFIDKSNVQFRTLAELLNGESSDREIDIQVKSYSLRLKSFLNEYYNENNGETLLSFHHEVEYAPTCEPSFSYMRIDAPMINLIDDIEDHCEKLPEELRQRLASRTFTNFVGLLTHYIGTSAAWIVSDCSNCYETEYGDYGIEWQNRFPLTVPIYMAIGMLCEMHSMLIRYTEIVDLGEGRDEALLAIKESYDSLLLKDFHAPHHRRVYKLTDISDDRSVQEFFSYKVKLEDKLAPLLAERARIRKEIEEVERAEQVRIAAEKARKHKEWLASPEYKAMRQKQLKSSAIGAGVFAVIIAIAAVAGNSGKDSSKDNQSSVRSSDFPSVLFDQSTIRS